MLRLLRVELYRNSHSVIVLALIAVYLFFALTGTLKFFAQEQWTYVQQMQQMNRDQYRNDPEMLNQEMRLLWKTVYAQTFSNPNIYALLTPGLLSLTITVDLKKRRVSEMTAAGNSKSTIFAAKSLCFCLLSAVIPVFCGLINFFVNVQTYQGYMNAGDFGFLLYPIAYTLCYAFFNAMVWLPLSWLCGELVSGLVSSFLLSLALKIAPSLLDISPVDMYNHSSGNKMLYYFIGEVSPNWGWETLLLSMFMGLSCFIVAWLIFRRRPLK